MLAVLHYRLEAHRQTEAPDTRLLISGLIEPAPHSDDPDVALTLHDRAIQPRVDLLVDRALENQELWIRELGEPTSLTLENWRKRTGTVACYRDLRGVDSDDALGLTMVYAKNRDRDRKNTAAVLRGENTYEAVAALLAELETSTPHASMLARPREAISTIHIWRRFMG